jgi:DNA-directed RNA polymerase specialized sigma subunit
MQQQLSLDLEESRPSSIDIAERNETITSVRSAVSQLEPGEKAIVEQVFGLEGIEKSKTQIAIELGITPQAVCNRMKRAFGKLSRYLTEELQ